MLVDFRAPARGPDGGVRMRKGEVTTLGIHDVEIEFAAQVPKQGNGLRVEPNTFRGQVVRSDNRGVARSIAACEIALFEHGDVANAVILGEVIGGREAV